MSDIDAASLQQIDIALHYLILGRIDYGIARSQFRPDTVKRIEINRIAKRSDVVQKRQRSGNRGRPKAGVQLAHIDVADRLIAGIADHIAGHPQKPRVI